MVNQALDLFFAMPSFTLGSAVSDNKLIAQPVKSKPHIVLREGFWRVSQIKFGMLCGPHSRALGYAERRNYRKHGKTSFQAELEERQISGL